MWALEPLIVLQHLTTCEHAIFEKFTITGVPTWFARCLEMYILGKGGNIRKKNDWAMSRSWKKSVNDWLEFAERSGVAFPAEDREFLKVK